MQFITESDIKCPKCGKLPIITSSGCVCCRVYTIGWSVKQLRKAFPELVSRSRLDQEIERERKRR